MKRPHDAVASENPNPSRRRAVEDVAERVRDRILSGEVAPGARLPAERDLAEEMGTSRLTLRAAITRLEAEGLVRPLHGSGTEVLDFREHGGIDLIAYLATQSFEGGEVPLALLRDLLELRRIVAVQLLPLVAVRASEEEILALRHHVIEQRRLVGDATAYVTADLQFARGLVRASHNFALELLFNTVARLIEGNAGLVLAFQANAARTLDVYDRLLELIALRDPRRVQRIAARVLESLDHTTLARIAELTGSPVPASPAGVGTQSRRSAARDSNLPTRDRPGNRS
jgi:DNA-binding FadR family transcriptional regulator